MNFNESLMARRLYDFERQQPNRTYAGDHSFEEWVQWYVRDCGASFVQSVYWIPDSPTRGMTGIAVLESGRPATANPSLNPI